MSAFSGKVTPHDILRALENAKAVHSDPSRLQREHDRLVAEVGGIEELARQWTTENLMEEFRTELYRTPHAPRQILPSQEDDRRRLRELIDKFPDLAREILGDDA